MKQADKIYNKIFPRIIELVERVIKDDANPAYMVAFGTGLRGDIQDALHS